MMRTTLDIDEPVLQELKSLQREEKVSLGQLASRLLASALASEAETSKVLPRPAWCSRPMGAKVDIDDKDAVHAILDSERP